LQLTIIVAAVVGIISSAITVLVMNNAPLMSPINANECTADETCEMNSAYVAGLLKTGSMSAGSQIGGGLYVDGGASYIQ